jgi:hypothetical protein
VYGASETMSALLLKANVCPSIWHVCQGPKANPSFPRRLLQIVPGLLKFGTSLKHANHIPAAFLRLSHSLQYCGQVMPAGTFPAAFWDFHSAPHARSRAYSACLGSAGFFVAGFAAVVVAAVGFAASALHFAM